MMENLERYEITLKHYNWEHDLRRKTKDEFLN